MKKIAIIGAGPAGLTAAYELLKSGKGYEVTVLESSSSIGGISKTVRVGDNRMDIGGHRFFSRDERVVAWWNDLMPMQGAPSMDDKLLSRQRALASGGPDPEKEDRVMLLRQRVSRIYYNKRFFDYPISMKWETIRNMGFFTTVKAGFSYLYSCVHKLPDNSLENFYINRFGKVLYSMFFEGYTEKVWGRHPREISADWGAQRVKGLSIIAIIKDIFRKIIPTKKNKQVETSLIEEFSYPKYGPGQLWETVATEVEKMGGRVLMDSCVTAIETEGSNVQALEIAKQEKTERLPLDICISSMAVKDLVASLPVQTVPDEVAQASAHLPYRDFVTVGLLVPRLNLKNHTKIKTLNNLVPDCWIYVQEPSVQMGRLQIFNNWSPYMVEDPLKSVWIGLEYFCSEGDDFWNMSDEECIAFAEEELVRIGVIEPNSVKKSHRERVQKAYPAYFDSYDKMDEIVAFLNRFENLYCVGRNGQHRYNNMDHSMVTSFEAVANILTGRKDKSNIWEVNTDQAYHEIKENEEQQAGNE